MPPQPDHVRLRPSRCPHCGYNTDAATALAGPTLRPSPGDLSVCLGCGEALQYDRRLRLVRISAAELAALNPDEREALREVQEAVRSFLASVSDYRA